MWKKVLILATFCCSGSWAQKIKVSVYYETLCPYSARFLVNQLYPVYQNLTDNLEIDLVAYGKATATNESGSWEFECQHGPAECYGNKVHSCAIELYPVDLSTAFVACSMGSTNASSDVTSEECAASSGISWSVLQECISSGQGDEILAANGRRTDKLIPNLINSVPTIVINDVFNRQLYNLAYANFENTVVFLLDQVQCGFCHFNGSNSILGSGKFVFGITLLLLIFQKLFI